MGDPEFPLKTNITPLIKLDLMTKRAQIFGKNTFNSIDGGHTYLLDNVLYLALMVGLYPAIFFISNNWAAVGLVQSIFIILVLSGSAFVSISSCYLVAKNIRFRRTNPDSSTVVHSGHLPNDLQEALLILISIYIGVGFLDFTIDDLQNQDIPISRNLILVIAGLTISFLSVTARFAKRVHLNLIRIASTLLSIMTTIAICSLAISLIVYFNSVGRSSSTIGTSDLDVYERISFKSTPNIYLIVPDSYPSNPALTKFFKYDNSKFSGELQRSGFTVYDEYFASYPFSLESMHSMLSMTHNYFNHSVGKDAANLRKVLGGEGNTVVNVLSNNGYESYYLHESNYLLKHNCAIDRCMPHWSELEALRKNLQNFYFFGWLSTMSSYSVNAAMTELIASRTDHSRSFVYKHFMDAHSYVKSYEHKYKQKLSAFRKAFPAKIERVNQILIDEVKLILDKDKSAIIIIVGDHGTWAGSDRSESGLMESETFDKLSVFLAIRWGDKYNGEYDSQIKSSVNLFRYIFAYLSQNDEVLGTKEKDDGYVKYGKVWKVLENGKVLSEPKVH